MGVIELLQFHFDLDTLIADYGPHRRPIGTEDSKSIGREGEVHSKYIQTGPIGPIIPPPLPIRPTCLFA